MLKHFRSSPLWLIGLFILFAEATAGLAAVKIEGWPQAALVIFVISYSTIVTAIFFAFLWFKPENFYGPSEYGDLSPEFYARALKGLPVETAQAVTRFEADPSDKDALFHLMDSLISDETKQHILLLRKLGNELDISDADEQGYTHNYEFISRSKGISFGIFSPSDFLRKLKGTELVSLSGGKNKLLLTGRGQMFADWLMRHEKDAETFNSSKGRWGKEQSASDVLREHFGKKNV